MKRTLICIGCPRGCHLEIEMDDKGSVLSVSGNACPRGPVYARQEMSDPRRVVTAVVHTTSASVPWLPVKTAAPLPRQHIAALLNHLYGITVQPPIRCGDIIVENAEGTGIPVVATESIV